MKLSIVIVNYNVQYFLEQCLLSIQGASKNLTTEIIVIDNNSTDGSCEMIQNKFPIVRIIKNNKNIGFSKANNRGVEKAKGEYVLILNPDTVLAEDTIDRAFLFAEKQSNLGAVGVKFIDGTGKFLRECKRNIPTVKIAGQKISGNSKNYYANQIGENEIAKAEILTGAFMLIKREVYLNIGGFDEDYFMFGEDIDLSYKLMNNGFQNYYYGKTKIIHYKGESTSKDISYLRNFYGSMQIFYKKHFKINPLLKLVSFLGFQLLIGVKYLKFTRKIKIKKRIKKVLLISDNKQICNNIIWQKILIFLRE
jgi:GT2 family glycosyltransferase